MGAGGGPEEIGCEPERCTSDHSQLPECNTLVAPFEIAVAILNLRVDPYVLVGVFLLLIAVGYCYGDTKRCEGCAA